MSDARLGDVTGLLRTFSQGDMEEVNKSLRIALLEHPILLRYLAMQALLPNSALFENRTGSKSVIVERTPMMVGYSEGQRAAYKNLLIQAGVLQGESSHDNT